MRTLIWNVTASTQTLPEVYGSVEIATRWGYVVGDGIETVLTNLGGFAGMNNKWAILPISPDESLGDKQVFGGGFAVALGADGNVPWGNIVGKPTWAAAAYSGSYNDLTNKPALAAVATSGAWSDISGKPVVASPSNAAAQPVGTTNNAGTSSDASRADHVHAHGAQTDGSLHAAVSGTANGFMTSTQFNKLEGIAANAAAVTATAPVAVGATAAVGTATDAARADHVHAHGDQAGGLLHAAASAAAAGFMSSAHFSKLEGVAANAAALTVDAALALGDTASAGSATTAAKADHVHTHGDRGGGSLHAVATTSVAGFMSGADKTKLDAISRAYDLMGYYAGETPPVGTDLLEVILPRNIAIEQLLVSSDSLQIALKLQLNGVDITPSAASPVSAAANAVLKVVTTGNTGTKAVFTVKAREV